MHPVIRAGYFGLAILHCAMLYAIEHHVRLGATALAVMAINAPAPKPRAGGGVQRSSLSTPRGHARNVDTVIDGGDVEQAKRFTAGGLKLPDGTSITIVEDREARVVLYITPNGATAVHLPEPEAEECEDESLDDTGIRMARERIVR